MMYLEKARHDVIACSHNLILCLRLMAFRPIDRRMLSNGMDQIFLMFVVYALLLFVSGYFIFLPNPQFITYGFTGLTSLFGLIVLVVFLLVKTTKNSEIFQDLMILVPGICFWFHLLWILMAQQNNFNMEAVFGEKKFIYVLYSLWFLSALTVSVIRLVEFRVFVIPKILIAFILFLFVPLHYLNPNSLYFWYMAYDPDVEDIMSDDQDMDDEDIDDESNGIEVNQEGVYYKQMDFINNLDSLLLPQRPGVVDTYFVGFGSYAEEDVFMKEVMFIKALFDDRFDTAGRSMGLINNAQTIDTNPIASMTNLDEVLKTVGEKIDVEEDILFLYVTSHGSSSHELSVSFWPLYLNGINPQDLKDSLKRSGIKWRVLLISACYSGGFIEPLKNSNTLVMSAAAVDRTSFGCGSKSEFTYFGEAVFKDQLAYSYDFIPSFEKAIKAIEVREQEEELDASNPILFVGDNIRDKLDRLGKDLASWNKKKHN